MFRTALGESTASLDSTVRSGCAGRPAVAAGRRGGQLPEQTPALSPPPRRVSRRLGPAGPP